MPPSMRFLGRRVYVGAVVILASIVALARTTFFLETEVLFPAFGLPMELPE